jgi:hypothetical protein
VWQSLNARDIILWAALGVCIWITMAFYGNGTALKVALITFALCEFYCLDSFVYIKYKDFVPKFARLVIVMRTGRSAQHMQHIASGHLDLNLQQCD